MLKTHTRLTGATAALMVAAATRTRRADPCPATRWPSRLSRRQAAAGRLVPPTRPAAFRGCRRCPSRTLPPRGRHRRGQAARGSGRRRAGESVEPHLPAERRHARDRASRPSAHRAERHARSAAHRRRARRCGRPARADCSKCFRIRLQREPVALSDLLEAVRAGRRDDGALPRAVRRQGARRRQGSLRRRQLQHRQPALRIEARVRTRRLALHDDRRARRSQRAQNLDIHGGKVLRLTEEGRRRIRTIRS